jgi:hypothetical protein
MDSEILEILSPEEQEKTQLTAFYHIFNLTSNICNLQNLLQELALFLLEYFQANTTLIFLKKGDPPSFRPVVCKNRITKIYSKIIHLVFSNKIFELIVQKKKSCAV